MFDENEVQSGKKATHVVAAAAVVGGAAATVSSNQDEMKPAVTQQSKDVAHTDASIASLNPSDHTTLTPVIDNRQRKLIPSSVLTFSSCP